MMKNNLQKSNRSRSQYLLRSGLIFTLIFTFIACSVQKSPITGQKRLYGYTWQQEIELGRQADSEIIQYYGLYDNPELTDYVTKVGKSVLNESHLRRDGADAQFRNTQFTFRVLNSPVVNAFALPGGFNYVTRGLLTHMTSEAQLAMVLGHEVAHVAARHVSQQAVQRQTGSILLIGGAVLGQELLGGPAQDVLELGGTAAQLLFLRYSRDAERESDRLGVEYAARAGYDASKGAAFFTTLKRLSDQAGQSIPGFMSSHPDPGEREKDIIDRSETWRQRGFSQTHIKQEEFYKAITGLVIGENPREGFVKDQTFYHPELAFSFDVPNSWNLINEPSQVILVTSDQKAITIFNIPDAQSIQQAIDQISNLEQVTVSNRESIQINGRQAQRLNATMVDNGRTYALIVTAIEYGGRVYRYLSYTLESDLNTFRSAMLSSAGTFRPVTDQAILNIQPARIRIYKTDRITTLANLLPATMPIGITKESMAILNQVDLNENLAVGTLLKLF